MNNGFEFPSRYNWILVLHVVLVFVLGVAVRQPADLWTVVRPYVPLNYRLLVALWVNVWRHALHALVFVLTLRQFRLNQRKQGSVGLGCVTRVEGGSVIVRRDTSVLLLRLYRCRLLLVGNMKSMWLRVRVVGQRHVGELDRDVRNGVGRGRVRGVESASVFQSQLCRALAGYIRKFTFREKVLNDFRGVMKCVAIEFGRFKCIANLRTV